MLDALRHALSDLLGTTVRGLHPVAGGDINRAFRVEIPARPVFVKVNADAPADMFAAEAAGLSALRGAGELRVPEVVGQGRAAGADFLVLEWIEAGPPGPGFDARLGEGLARLHRHTSERFGFERDNYIGSLPQPNDWRPSWLELFRDQRLRAQLAIGRQRGTLPPKVIDRVEGVCQGLGEWIPANSEPSLLHGDMWGGNHLSGPDGLPVLIDPAVYYGDREAELAFTRLFGAFSAAFYDAYEAVWPLPAGHRGRVDLYNLYPLLVHANLFGGSYVARVDRLARGYRDSF